MTQTIQRFSEAISGGSLQVDESAGVIRGVKIIGTKSKNKRQYLAEGLRKAIPLYEGKGVFANHKRRKDAEEDRNFDDKFAWLESVRQDADGGLSGDLHYLKTDPRGPKLAEAARRKPEMFGLSHDAEGSVKTVNGETIVEEIRSVYSVDVVTDPATTRSLRESTESTMLREVAIRDELHILAALVESGYGDMTPEMDDEEGEGESDPVMSAFREVIDSILDGPGSSEEKLKKIKLILQTQEKLMADAAKPQDTAPAADPAMAESFKALQADNAKLTEAVAKLTETVNALQKAKDEAVLELPAAKRGELQESVKPGTYEAEAAKIKNRFGKSAA